MKGNDQKGREGWESQLKEEEPKYLQIDRVTQI